MPTIDPLDFNSLYPEVRQPMMPKNTLLDAAYRKRRLDRAIAKQEAFDARYENTVLSDAGQWTCWYLRGRVEALRELDMNNPSRFDEATLRHRLTHLEGELKHYDTAPDGSTIPHHLGELQGLISVFEDIVQTFDDLNDGVANL